VPLTFWSAQPLPVPGDSVIDVYELDGWHLQVITHPALVVVQELQEALYDDREHK